MPNEALQPLIEALHRSQREAGALLGESEGLWVVCSIDRDANPLKVNDEKGRVGLHGNRIYLASSEGTGARIAGVFNAKLRETPSEMRMFAEPARQWVSRRVMALHRQEMALLSMNQTLLA